VNTTQYTRHLTRCGLIIESTSRQMDELSAMSHFTLKHVGSVWSWEDMNNREFCLYDLFVLAINRNKV
jgi:hypothetical protein